MAVKIGSAILAYESAVGIIKNTHTNILEPDYSNARPIHIVLSFQVGAKRAIYCRLRQFAKLRECPTWGDFIHS
jgi:hypothetical protein